MIETMELMIKLEDSILSLGKGPIESMEKLVGKAMLHSANKITLAISSVSKELQLLPLLPEFSQFPEVLNAILPKIHEKMITFD